MATTLPTFSKTIDNSFTHTWMEMKDEAVDNILNATVIWAALIGAGCMQPQVGSKYITRTVTYDYQAAVDITRGDTLPSGEKELETDAIWSWRTIAGHVQRDIFDDQENNGPAKIKDLVATKLRSMKSGLEQKLETSMFNTFASNETGKALQGLNDMVPTLVSGGASGNATGGTYGGINRPTTFADSGNGVYRPSVGNTWWGANYKFGTLATVEDDLISDMKALYNSTGNNASNPNLIVGTQSLVEIYQEFGLDISQIIKDDTTNLVDLGFEVTRYNGKPFIWSPNMTANHLLMLNTDWIEIVYDPTIWFEMTDWKPETLGTKRIAHILAFANMITTQPRRHGRLQYA